MKRHQLGTSDLAISTIGLGTWAIAGPGWEFGWGAQDDSDSLATLEYAIDQGVNWIDMAAVYGLGHAEAVVGQLLRRIPTSRRPLVFTKGSLVWDEQSREITHSLDPASLTREVESSLRRLGTDVIDLYQVHWPSFPPGGPDEGLEKALHALDRLKVSGKIRAIGVSNFNVSQLERALAVTSIASLQPPYSALMRDVEQEILPFCQEKAIGVIPYSVLQSGLLSGRMNRDRIHNLPEDDWRKTRSPDFQEPRLSECLALVKVFRRIGISHQVTPAAIAIAWVLRRPEITGAILGARHPGQVDDLLKAAQIHLNAAEIEEIRPFLPDGKGTNVPAAIS